MKAMNETEKLKSSSETYKRDQLQKQLADKDEELQRAREQAAGLVSDNDGEPLLQLHLSMSHLGFGVPGDCASIADMGNGMHGSGEGLQTLVS